MNAVPWYNSYKTNAFVYVDSTPFIHRLVDCMSLQSDTYWYHFLQVFLTLAEQDKAYLWYNKEEIIKMLDSKLACRIRQDEDGQIFALVINNVLDENDGEFRLHHTHHQYWYHYI